jgi:hypothetical protein
MKMEQTQCSETSAIKHHTPGNNPKDCTQQKSRRILHVWGRGEVHRGFWYGDLMERDRLEYLDVDGRIMVKHVLRNRAGCVDWFGPAQDRYNWHAVVNTLMKL